MKDEIKDRLAKLREAMNVSGIDAVIIPQTDPHQSEYIADHWQVRRFLSGFTGSAGTLVVTATEALLWVDSRYFLQGAIQLEGTEIKLMKGGLPTTPIIEYWLIENLPSGSVIGVDGMLFSMQSAESMRKTFADHALVFSTDFDPVDMVWPERPALPSDKVAVYDERYAGENVHSKTKRILDNTHSQLADAVFISALDEIAWLLNIRCTDVKYNPVATSYLYVSPEGSTLFIDEAKIDDDTRAYLKGNNVSVLPYLSVKEFLGSLPKEKKVLIEAAKTSTAISSILGEKAVCGTSPVAVPKACRNATEIAGVRDAHVRDGVALVKAVMEIEKCLSAGERLTEMGVDKIFYRHRSAQPLFMDESFGTIAGYGPHGAIVHYEADEESDAVIEPRGLLLIDSGAQYLDGTTDITRTICLGSPTALEKHDFTLVLKGHIALADMIFPEGTLGVQIDCEARKYLWRESMNYLHGTGHGVGHYLNVHEGPQSIRMNPTPVPLMEGMITSNEPGLYRENVHGIRTENLVLCIKAMETDFGKFLKFDTITLFPIDTTLIDTAMMTHDEIDWVNRYHEKVRAMLNPHLNADEQLWLQNKTTPISKR